MAAKLLGYVAILLLMVAATLANVTLKSQHYTGLLILAIAAGLGATTIAIYLMRKVTTLWIRLVWGIVALIGLTLATSTVIRF